ncbi:MAG: hypothetical protein KH989_09645 [Kocuria rhizophila]|nr:hypothetical protein [Kocuria rhizophila]
MPFDPQAPATGPMPVFHERGDQGYKKSLGHFQIQMIGIGGAIGVGLFLGIGGRLAAAGPALVVSYLVVSAVVYLLMRALGELVIHRPTTGAWVSYAREFVGDRFAFMTGWIYVALSAVAGVGEIAAHLHRSKQTVSAQKVSAMRKLGLANDAALFIYVQEHGLA